MHNPLATPAITFDSLDLNLIPSTFRGSPDSVVLNASDRKTAILTVVQKLRYLNPGHADDQSNLRHFYWPTMWGDYRLEMDHNVYIGGGLSLLPATDQAELVNEGQFVVVPCYKQVMRNSGYPVRLHAEFWPAGATLPRGRHALRDVRLSVRLHAAKVAA